MFTRKIYEVPVYLWVILLCLLGYLLYNKFFTSEHMSNATATKSPMVPSMAPSVAPSASPSTNAPGDFKLYNFNTAWCGYSVRFQEEWNKFADEISKKNNLYPVKVYDIKCDNAANESMCRDYEIPGYPTVVIEKNGKKEVYDGPRTADALLETVQKNL
jgi:hypothetical protein